MSKSTFQGDRLVYEAGTRVAFCISMRDDIENDEARVPEVAAHLAVAADALEQSAPETPERDQALIQAAEALSELFELLTPPDA